MSWFSNVIAPVVVVIGLIVFAGYLALTYGRPYLTPFFLGDSTTIHVGNVPIKIDAVADTPETRFRGLSGREGLPETSGLLFVFDEDGYHGITMRNMRFAIDVIWVSSDLRVVHIERNMLPQTYPRVFEPPRPARFVIETNARLTETFSISVGDTVAIPRMYLPDDVQFSR